MGKLEERTELNLDRRREEKRSPIPQEEKAADQALTTLGDAIRLLRNGLAHGNISFVPGGQGQIAALRIENRDGQGRRTWGAIVTPDNMKQFLERFIALVEELDQQAGRRPNKIA
jgi:hypothetical protein